MSFNYSSTNSFWRTYLRPLSLAAAVNSSLSSPVRADTYQLRESSSRTFAEQNINLSSGRSSAPSLKRSLEPSLEYRLVRTLEDPRPPYLPPEPNYTPENPPPPPEKSQEQEAAEGKSYLRTVFGVGSLGVGLALLWYGTELKDIEKKSCAEGACTNEFSTPVLIFGAGWTGVGIYLLAK
ncbi:MAG: hypothetical protein AABX13_03535 [Nanoarchaeota archaeon]